MTAYLILFLIVFPIAVGVLYGLVEREIARRLKNHGWQVRDASDEKDGWEAEYNYNLPPSDKWLTVWEAWRAQRR